jgi:hypothetical protein
MLDLDTISFCATVCPPGIPMRDAQLVYTNLGKNRGLDEALQVTSIVMHNQRTSELDEQAVPPLRKALDSLVLSPVHPGGLPFAHRMISAPAKCSKCGASTLAKNPRDNSDRNAYNGMLYTFAEPPQRVRVYKSWCASCKRHCCSSFDTGGSSGAMYYHKAKPEAGDVFALSTSTFFDLDLMTFLDESLQLQHTSFKGFTDAHNAAWRKLLKQQGRAEWVSALDAGRERNRKECDTAAWLNDDRLTNAWFRFTIKKKKKKKK